MRAGADGAGDDGEGNEAGKDLYVMRASVGLEVKTKELEQRESRRGEVVVELTGDGSGKEGGCLTRLDVS